MPNTIAVTVKDQTHLLPRLTPRECINITTKLWEQQRVKLLKDMDDGGASAVVRCERLEQHRRAEGSPALLMDLCKTYTGQVEIIQTSLKRAASSGIDIDDFDLDQFRLFVLAGNLCGFEIDDAIKETSDDPDDGMVRDHPSQASGGTGLDKPA